MLFGMANPKVIRPCRQCGSNREHYTRRNGRVISPCCECQIAKAKTRQDNIRADPDALDKQRDQWQRIKKRQRMIERGEVGTHTAEPAIQPASIPMSERVKRRRRRREAASTQPPPPPLPVSPPDTRPRRRIRGPNARRSMESGLD